MGGGGEGAGEGGGWYDNQTKPFVGVCGVQSPWFGRTGGNHIESYKNSMANRLNCLKGLL